MLWDSTNSWKAFFLLLVVEAFSLQKVVELLEEEIGKRSDKYVLLYPSLKQLRVLSGSI